MTALHSHIFIKIYRKMALPKQRGHINEFEVVFLERTCLGVRRMSWAEVVATMALLFALLVCKDTDKPDTSCTPRSVMVTLSSRTITVFSARMESERGDRTWEEKGNTSHETRVKTFKARLASKQHTRIILGLSHPHLSQS